MLHLEIKGKEDKYTLSYIEFLKGAGCWQFPLSNNPDIKSLTTEQAKELTVKILDVVDDYLNKNNFDRQ